MPGLVRGMARTAAIVGTATATRNAVDRRQANKNVAAYNNAEQQYAQQQYAPPPQQYAPPPQQYAPPPAPPAAPAPSAGADMMTQLNQLTAMYNAGMLTADEFAAAKQKLLAG